jgi:hypothetical protein
LLSFERFGSCGWELSGRREAVRHIKAGVSWLAPILGQVLRRLPLRGFRARKE